jgi:cytochrome P450
MPVMPVEGVGVVLTGRAEIDEAFRDPTTFSSNMSAIDLKNVRPLIPLQIDPPDHKKYRKILDPIFAPRQMALLEVPVTQLVNDLIDGFVDRGEVDFAREFSVPRIAARDANLGGCPINQGDDVMVMLGSANTDETEFDDAETVRFDRESNRHLAFGGGIHRCLGSHLARQELRIALREWHRRIPEYSVAPGHTLAYTSGIRSIEHFPMNFVPAN